MGKKSQQMDLIVSKAKAIRSGEKMPIAEVMSALKAVTDKIQGWNRLQRVTGQAVVVGPIRGHAPDFAHYLLHDILPNRASKNIVMLGNYSDGAHQSVEVLYLIALLFLHSGRRVIPLVGQHEMCYPTTPEFFGSLRNELLLRSMQMPVGEMEQHEHDLEAFFRALPVACVIDSRYFCVAGGPASGYRFLSDIEAETSQKALVEFVLNEQMDEDEERVAGGGAFVASPTNELSFRFTFNAVCNFVSRNQLVCMIVGTEYHISRPEYDSFSRPNHYKESIYFPGFMLGRTNPETHVPAVLTIFSAPCFCGVNRNNACIVTIANEHRLEVRELKAYPRRPFITPGSQDHAFSWAETMLERALCGVCREMIFGALPEKKPTPESAHYQRLERVMTEKMRKMCRLLKAHDLPMPELPDRATSLPVSPTQNQP